jgi:hypothetical protein
MKVRCKNELDVLERRMVDIELRLPPQCKWPVPDKTSARAMEGTRTISSTAFSFGKLCRERRL